MNELISVIVPIYNIEKYIGKCIDSLINQSYDNLEIILVNDGSTDSSPIICDEWKKKDKRIKVIHKKNGGLSDARNVGMEHSTGSLISFIDGDDWLDKHFYKVLVSVMKSNDSDIVVGGYLCITTRENIKIPERYNVITLNNQESMLELINERLIEQMACNKIYKKAVIGNIKFPYGKYHEDVFWTYQIIARAKRTSVVDYKGYYYYQRADSIMGSKFSEKRLDALEAKSQRIEFLKRNYPHYLNLAIKNFKFDCLYSAQCAIRFLTKKERFNIVQIIKKYSLSYEVDYDFMKTQKISHQIWIFIMDKFFYLTCKIRIFLKIGM